MPQDLLTKAFKLEQADYYTPELERINPQETMLTRIGHMGLSNKTSQYPVIGTKGFVPCMAIIMYNTKTKTAGVIHKVRPEKVDLEALLHAVRPDGRQTVNVHVFGCAKLDDDQVESNRVRFLRLTQLVEDIAALGPAVRIKTFDVYDKPKPHGVAINTKNGHLIRGSALFNRENEAEADATKINTLELSPSFSGWQSTDGDFNGILPEHQKERSFP